MSISGPFAAPELCRTGHVERRGTFALKRQGSPALSKAKIEAAMGIRKRDRAFLEHIRCRHSHCAQRARMHAPLARRPRCPCSQSGTERACHGRQAVQQSWPDCQHHNKETLPYPTYPSRLVAHRLLSGHALLAGDLALERACDGRQAVQHLLRQLPRALLRHASGRRRAQVVHQPRHVL